jgi:hypothetical protein
LLGNDPRNDQTYQGVSKARPRLAALCSHDVAEWIYKGFPKTYSQVCGIDTAKDEALVFDDMSEKEETPTRLDLWLGLSHIFFHSFKDIPQSKEWENDTMNGFDWLLSS